MKRLPLSGTPLIQYHEIVLHIATANSDAVGSFLKNATNNYEPTNEISRLTDFENLVKHPENIRIAIGHDELPDIYGSVWETFPSQTTSY